MLSRIKLIIAVGAAMAVMVTVSVAPAMAQNSKADEGKAIAAAKAKVELPPTGGPSSSLLLPTAAMLLVGSGILGYAVLRRR